MLENTHKFKLKGVSPLTYHLGCDYFVIMMGICVMILESILLRLWISLNMCLVASQRNTYHPWRREIIQKSISHIDENVIRKDQTMIGCLQWAVSLGRFDIQTLTMMMSNFPAAPRIVHLN
jgi:hypothetical protein